MRTWKDHKTSQFIRELLLAGVITDFHLRTALFVSSDRLSVMRSHKCVFTEYEFLRIKEVLGYEYKE